MLFQLVADFLDCCIGDIKRFVGSDTRLYRRPNGLCPTLRTFKCVRYRIPDGGQEEERNQRRRWSLGYSTD